MKNEKKIKEEVEKTLNSMDNIQNLEENPYLFTRINAEIESDRKMKENVPVFGGRILKPAALLLFVLLNIFTSFYIFNSNSNSTVVTKKTYLSAISSEYSLNHSVYSNINESNGD